jgi:saccharopine dehydrogenase-like NADP-dependent oxidoreductase
MRAVICGVGRMGTAIAWAMDKLGFEVIGMDRNPEAKKNMPERKFWSDPQKFHTFCTVERVEDIFTRLTEIQRPDVLISSLPYHQTEEVGDWCVNNSVRYCDLGGRVDVSHNINEWAKLKAERPVFTDLGLAPGWVNILAEEGYRELHGEGQITKVEMMVGGLPDYLESSENPLRYKITWSVDGLINEYRDDCIILKDGQITKVKGMDGLETVETKNTGVMEAFYTSGGASHSIESMKERGVSDCSYKTLRYQGHCSAVKFLMKDCQLDDEALYKVFVTGCGYANKDEVFIIAKVHKDNRSWVEEKVIKSDDKFSAMQKATAFPISCVASLMAEGRMEGKKDQHRDYWTQYSKALTYADVPFGEFNRRVESLLDSSQKQPNKI